MAASCVVRLPNQASGAQSVLGALAYDAVRNRVVLFGVSRSGQDFSDTWEWNGTAWSQITPQ